MCLVGAMMMKKNLGLVTGWPERRVTKTTAPSPLGTHHTPSPIKRHLINSQVGLSDLFAAHSNLTYAEIPPESLGVTLGDKKFKTGYAKGFPSSKPMQVSDEDSGSSESEEELSSDEEFPPQKRKRV